MKSDGRVPSYVLAIMWLKVIENEEVAVERRDSAGAATCSRKGREANVRSVGEQARYSLQADRTSQLTHLLVSVQLFACLEV